MIKRQLLKAEVVYSGLGTPQLNAAILIQEIQGQSQVVAFENFSRLSQAYPDLPVTDVGFAISPMPVNAHMHLDLTSMAFSPGSYEDFIRKVVRHDRSSQRNLEAAKSGIASLKAQGIAVIGDIVSKEEVMQYLLGSDLGGVAYWEVFAPDPADAERVFGETLEKLQGFKKLERPGGMKVGLSPHTAHTVSAPLLQKLALFAKHHALPMQIHVAESVHELSLYQHASGPLWELYQPFMPYWQAPGLSPVAYLEQLGVLEAKPSLVHMVNVSEQDVRTVQKAGCTVIHCPRSNRALECGRFPWELYAKHGVTVALGTDSAGSSPSLSLAEELKAALALHGSKAGKQGLIWAAVKGGYRALAMTPPQVTRGDALAKLFFWD